MSIVRVYSIVHIYIHRDTGHLHNYTFTGALGCLVNFSACEQETKQSLFYTLKRQATAQGKSLIYKGQQNTVCTSERLREQSACSWQAVGSEMMLVSHSPSQAPLTQRALQRNHKDYGYSACDGGRAGSQVPFTKWPFGPYSNHSWHR